MTLRAGVPRLQGREEMDTVAFRRNPPPLIHVPPASGLVIVRIDAPARPEGWRGLQPGFHPLVHRRRPAADRHGPRRHPLEAAAAHDVAAVPAGGRGAGAVGPRPDPPRPGPLVGPAG